LLKTLKREDGKGREREGTKHPRNDDRRAPGALWENKFHVLKLPSPNLPGVRGNKNKRKVRIKIEIRKKGKVEGRRI